MTCKGVILRKAFISTISFIVFMSIAMNIGKSEWWDTSWNKCKNITLYNDDPEGYRARNYEYIEINLTGLTFTAGDNEVRIINAPCNQGGSEVVRDNVNSGVGTESSGDEWFEAGFLINRPANANVIYSVYYDNPQAGTYGLKTDLEFSGFPDAYTIKVNSTHNFTTTASTIGANGTYSFGIPNYVVAEGAEWIFRNGTIWVGVSGACGFDYNGSAGVKYTLYCEDGAQSWKIDFNANNSRIKYHTINGFTDGSSSLAGNGLAGANHNDNYACRWRSSNITDSWTVAFAGDGTADIIYYGAINCWDTGTDIESGVYLVVNELEQGKSGAVRKFDVNDGPNFYYPAQGWLPPNGNIDAFSYVWWGFLGDNSTQALNDTYWNARRPLMFELGPEEQEVIPPPPPKNLIVKLVGELDYAKNEFKKVRLAALVKEKETGKPVSNATVTLSIYDIDWRSRTFQMIESEAVPGVYEWVSPYNAADFPVKGVFVAVANATYGSGPSTIDMTEFHIDPVPFDFTNLFALSSLLITTFVLIWLWKKS